MRPTKAQRLAAMDLLGVLGWPDGYGAPLGGGALGGGVIYLLDDEFPTAAAAPLTSPRTCEPGPGVLTLVQVDGQYDITSNKLTEPIQATAAWGDQGYYEAVGRSRVSGRALYTQINMSDNSQGKVLAWFTSAAVPVTQTAQQHSIYTANALGVVSSNSSLFATGYVLLTATDYQLAIVLRSTGAWFFVKGGVFTNWSLFWIETEGATATLYPGVGNFDYALTREYIRLRDLPAPFDSLHGLATVRDTTLVSGDTWTGTADGLHDFEFTLPGVPILTDKVERRYRVQDTSNYWTAYAERNVAAWDFKLDSVVAGTPTNRVTAAGVGTPDMIRTISNSNLHDCFTRAGTAWTKRGSQVTNASFSSEPGQAIVVVTTNPTTLTAVTDTPYTSSVYNELDRT